jgi:hypothetical protein
MADLHDIIKASIAEVSEEPAETPDISDDTGAEVAAEPVVEATEVAAVEPVVAEVKTPAEVDELAAELEALGIKAPKEGERENRLPYSRVKKIIANSRKKLVEAHTGELKTREEKLTAAEKRLKDFDAADNLLKTDPDRYLQLLATVNPRYQQYLGVAHKGQQPEVVQQPVVKNEPAPGPDATFADGSKGYSAEGLEKLREWDRRQAVQEAQKLFDARLAPIEKANKTREEQQRANEYRQAQIPIIRNQIAVASKTWGKAFDDDYAKQSEGKSEILKYMQANPDVPFDTCVATVLLPKVQADRTTMRADLLKEINARPKAAVKAPAAASKVGAEPVGERTTEDVIRDAIAGLKR